MFNPLLPNQADEKTIRKYFVERGAVFLKKQAGYQPAHMVLSAQTRAIPQIIEAKQHWSQQVMRRVLGEDAKDYHYHVPYLLILWVWLGKDNPYAFCDFLSLNDVRKRFLVNTFRVIMGGDSSQGYKEQKGLYVDLRTVIQIVTKTLPEDYNVREFDRTVEKTKKAIEETITQQTKKWATLNETEILTELQSLTFTFYDKICEQNTKGS